MNNIDEISFWSLDGSNVGCPTNRTSLTLSSNFNSHNSGFTAKRVDRTSSDSPVRFPLLEFGNGID